MLKNTLKKLEKMNYVLIIKSGAYNVIDRYTKSTHLSFSSDEPAEKKEKIIKDFYYELISK